MRKIYLVIFLAVFLIGITFAIYTKHVWEDWYVVYRGSKNLANGHGLVFNKGERVYFFTSPIGVLLPTALNIITFSSSDGLVFWLLRIIGCSLFGISAVLLLRIAEGALFRLLPTIFLISMFATDLKIIDFSINGMETPFMVFFLVLNIYILTVASGNLFFNLGLVWAGLMWTRPDSIVYIFGLSIGYLIFNSRVANIKSRLDLIKIFLKAAIVLAVLYVPWLIWTWYYYGSIIPHTIIAKGLGIPIININEIKNFLIFPLKHTKSLDTIFMPIYYKFGGWGHLPIYFTRLLALLVTFYWCLPFARPQARAISFAIWLAHYYLIKTLEQPWYFVSVTVLSIFILSHIVQQGMVFLDLLKNKLSSKFSGRLKIIFYLIVGLVLFTGLSFTAAGAYMLRLQQEIIEKGNRTQIGLWLKEKARSPEDTVFLEPLGYIGYYSQLKILDCSGIASREVVAARCKLGNSFAKLIFELKPDWLVLRPWEIQSIQNEMPSLLTSSYRPLKVFDVSDKVLPYSKIPGHSYLKVDQTFTVFKKIPQSK